ncbi:GMC oxidoreductase [Lentinus tigrinus ALCF2SS1-7]|uniref:GMC oxidoreductase n=1 Tax=Lentinus tigrinus ALCF2SS1-6 TaxID=1328759 RepID=A0A5C2RT84_9APHY|nr:GMC oxidoreductase [Lentinus tigrinus ALCF2SS1-6]RPD69901.1 GMC oxidoreductase [Lentinus tigrinus ALCF2SS1-7]
MPMTHKLASIDDVSNKTFDFVVIGGGVAGCVLASRLSENPSVSVALLEAGNAHFDDPLITVPDGWMQQMFNPEYDWVFRTTPQKHAKNGLTTPDGLQHESFFWTRGKGLGGSSCTNFLFWIKPQREEIEAIEKLGNPGWNWERYFEATKRSEVFTPAAMNNFPQYLELYKETSVGTSGPVPVSFARTVSGIEPVLQKALESLGVPINDDGTGGNLSGTFKSMSTIDGRTGMRSTAASGYLIPALSRPNLAVLTGAYVRRLVTKSESEVVATGVEFEHEGKIYTVNVSREVLLCAGTIKSPHILELSGIGDKNVLERLGVTVRLDLPSVGANLQDHVIFTGSVVAMKEDQGFVTSDTIRLPEVQAKLHQLYGQDGGAIALASSGVTFVPAQVVSSPERVNALAESIEHKLSSQANAIPSGLKAQYEHQLKMLKNPTIPDLELVIFPVNMHPVGPPKPLAGMFPVLGHPFSRGTIHAGSNDPHDQPLIDPNYLAEDIDFELLVDSFNFLRKAMATSEWQMHSQGELLPGPAVTGDALHEHIRNCVSTTWHACGTCSMLPKEQGGVVDPRLKVYGTRNIRVADLSTLPLLTAAHTQAITYAIAEQAADIIKVDHGL